MQAAITNDRCEHIFANGKQWKGLTCIHHYAQPTHIWLYYADPSGYLEIASPYLLPQIQTYNKARQVTPLLVANLGCRKMPAVEYFTHESSEEKKSTKDPFVDWTREHFRYAVFLTHPLAAAPTALRVLTVSVVMFASLGIGNLSLLLLLLTSIGVSLLPFPFYPLLLLTRSSTRWTFHFTTSASRDGVHQDAVRHACWAEEEAS